jgi:anti-anti-sigma factor
LSIRCHTAAAPGCNLPDGGLGAVRRSDREKGEAAMTHESTLRWQTTTDAATGIRIYRLNGALTDSDESYSFLASARGEMSADPRPLLLDLGGVEHVTSTGVGIVAALYKSAANADRTIALAGLSRRNEILLEVVQLFRFIAAFADERAALEGYAAGGWTPGS